MYLFIHKSPDSELVSANILSADGAAVSRPTRFPEVTFSILQLHDDSDCQPNLTTLCCVHPVKRCLRPLFTGFGLPDNAGSFLMQIVLSGPMAQLVRAFGSHPKGHRFESCWAHSLSPHTCEQIRRPAKNTGFFAGLSLDSLLHSTCFHACGATGGSEITDTAFAFLPVPVPVAVQLGAGFHVSLRFRQLT